MIKWREHNIYDNEGGDSDEQKEFVFNLFEEEEPDKILTHEFKSKSSAPDITITLYGREECNTSTGLAVWGGAETMCNYLLDERDSESHLQIFQRQSRILELGSGLGLCGIFVAMAFNPTEVILSDGDVDVLERLQKNIELNATGDETAISSAQLVWGENLDTFEQEHGKFDVIIAAECMYMPPSLYTIWSTVKYLLQHDGVFLYVHQASSQVQKEKVLEMATECGYDWTTSSSYPLVHLFRRKNT